MSHVVTIDCKITDLEAFRLAVERCGGKLERAERYRWWGSYVGDYPLPKIEGMTPGQVKAKLGRCDGYRVQVPGCGWDVGLWRMADGSYQMMYDFYQGGRGLERALGGRGLPKLKQAYAIVKAKRALAAKGIQARERQLADGSVQLVYNVA